MSFPLNRKNILAGIFLGFAIFISLFLFAEATSKRDIVFPVPELGSCKSESDCRTYCDNPKNITACVAFAEKHNLISQDEAKQARKFAQVGVGPGGCTTKDACENYCNDVSNIDECISFAERNNLMQPGELEEARKVQAALAKGAKLPGGCTNKQQCDVYCNEPTNMEKCIAFAEAAGFIPPDELEEARKVLAAVRRGAKPPPCRGKAECDVYCSEPNNFEACIVFAEAAGFVSSEEAAMARKTGGKGPGNCRGREECDRFCQDKNNFETCLAFAEEHSFISKDEVEMARKTGGKGPGDCKSKEQCEAFCQNPANQETCFNFAKEHGLVPEEDLRRMKEGRQQMTQGFIQAPPEVIECLTGALGSETIEKLKAGAAMPSRDIGDKMRECFEKIRPLSGQGQGGPAGGSPSGFGGGVPGAGFSGPGGCKTPEECTTYCQVNPKECQNFMPPQGSFQPPGEFQPPLTPQVPGEFRPPEGRELPSGMQLPPEIMNLKEPPSPEQIQQFQQQMQQQMQQFQQPMMPPEGFTPPPPSSQPPPQELSQPPPSGNILDALRRLIFGR